MGKDLCGNGRGTDCNRPEKALPWDVRAAQPSARPSMPKPESSNSNQAPSCETPRFRPNWPAAAAGLAVGLWLLAAMVSYLPLQKGIFSAGTTTDQAHVAKNWMGLVGVDSARLAFIWFGLAGWLLPIFGLWSFWLALWNARRPGADAFAGHDRGPGFSGGPHRQPGSGERRLVSPGD